MSARNACIGFVAIVMLLSSWPLTVNPSAQGGCGREIARQEAALRQFDADLNRESMNFAKDEAREAALGVVKEKLAGNPTAQAAAEIRERWKEWTGYIEQARSFTEVLSDLSKCLNTNNGRGCLKELLDRNRRSDELLNRVNDATNKWLESLENETISEVKERVDKARSIMQNFTNRAGNMATGAAANAVENCFKDFEQRARTQQAQRDPVDLRSSQPSSPPSTPQPPTQRPPENTGNSGNAGASAGSGGGMGAGAIGGIAAAGVGAGVGLYALNEYQKSVKCTQYETEMDGRMTTLQNSVNALISCGQSLSCVNSREPAVRSAASGILTTAGNWCTCLGADGAANLSAADKAAVRDALNSLRSYGVSTGTLPACFR